MRNDDGAAEVTSAVAFIKTFIYLHTYRNAGIGTHEFMYILVNIPTKYDTNNTANNIQQSDANLNGKKLKK